MATERTVPANGARLHVRQAGEGQPLILLHGGMFTSTFWDRMLPHFGDGYRLLLVDSRGHGRSDNPAGQLSYGLMADDVIALIEALDLDRPAVCGYSDGGQICLEIGVRYPGRTGPLVVGAARFTYPEQYVQALRRMVMVGEDDQPDVERFEAAYPAQCRSFSEEHGYVYGPDHWKTLLRWSTEMYLTPFDLDANDFARIAVPTLVVCGDRDSEFPVEESAAIYRAIPGADLAVAPGADHYFPYFRPEVLPAIVREFLGRRWPAPP